MQALLGSGQLSPSATLRPSASTTHSEEEEVRRGEHGPPTCILLPGAHPEGSRHSASALMVLISATGIQTTYQMAGPATSAREVERVLEAQRVTGWNLPMGQLSAQCNACPMGLGPPSPVTSPRPGLEYPDFILCFPLPSAPR